MDRGLGGVKDGLLAIAFTMICDATVLAGWVLKWCINDSSECERFYWLTFLTEHQDSAAQYKTVGGNFNLPDLSCEVAQSVKVIMPLTF